MKVKYQKWIEILLRFGFGILLIFSSFHKIIHPWGFSFDVENYRIVGEGISRLVAVWLPYLELILALLLISGIWLNAAVIINVLLMGLFFLMVLQAYVRGLDISCGCFYPGGEDSIGPVKIIENVVFLGLSVILLLIYQNSLPADKKNKIS